MEYQSKFHNKTYPLFVCSRGTFYFQVRHANDFIGFDTLNLVSNSWTR